MARATSASVASSISAKVNCEKSSTASKSLGLADKLLTIAESEKNPGSCSVPMAIAENSASGRILIAGFGAGLSASAGVVTVRRQ